MTKLFYARGLNHCLRYGIESFINQNHCEHWQPENTHSQVNFANTHIIVSVDFEKITGVLLLKQKSLKEFYCSLVLALNTEAFVDLVQQLEDTFPGSVITSATRRGKLKHYKQPAKLLQKIRSLHGRILQNV